MAVAKVKISLQDGSKEPTSIGGKVATGTAGAAIDTYLAALAPVCHEFSVLAASLTTPLTITPVIGDDLGENERSKTWAITCKNSMGFTETHYVPCADWSISPTTDDLDILAGDGAALKSAFEALFKDSNGGALTVNRIFKSTR